MTTLDEQIRGMFAKLNDRKAKLETLKQQSAPKWKTTGTFRQIGATSVTSMQTASKETIIEIATQVELLAGAQESVAKKLGTDATALIQGYKLEDWYHDFQKRLATINQRDEEAAIADLEKRLNSVLSPEERRRIEVELLLKEV